LTSPLVRNRMTKVVLLSDPWVDRGLSEWLELRSEGDPSGGRGALWRGLCAV
jgi:hypothetical protein